MLLVDRKLSAENLSHDYSIDANATWKQEPQILHSAVTNNIFIVRRYALHGLCDRNSVCLFVCLSHSWTVSTWFDLRSWFLHYMVAPTDGKFAFMLCMQINYSMCLIKLCLLLASTRALSHACGMSVNVWWHITVQRKPLACTVSFSMWCLKICWHQQHHHSEKEQVLGKLGCVSNKTTCYFIILKP